VSKGQGGGKGGKKKTKKRLWGFAIFLEPGGKNKTVGRKKKRGAPRQAKIFFVEGTGGGWGGGEGGKKRRGGHWGEGGGMTRPPQRGASLKKRGPGACFGLAGFGHFHPETYNKKGGKKRKKEFSP